MGDVLIIAVVAAAFIFAARGMIKRGKNGCCGGGGGSVPVTKELEGEKIGEKIVTIQGMHCENCKNSVERQIDHIQGAVAKVDLKKNIAVVSLSRMVDDEEIRAAVERLDFKVLNIETRMAG